MYEESAILCDMYLYYIILLVSSASNFSGRCILQVGTVHRQQYMVVHISYMSSVVSCMQWSSYNPDHDLVVCSTTVKYSIKFS